MANLILPLHRCDPAPFYLFDEIDQALDANHRLAVARLIQKQASSKENPTQFITSTFRSELVSVANKCYGLVLENRSSRIYPLPKVTILSLTIIVIFCRKMHSYLFKIY